MLNFYGDIATNNRANNPLISNIGYNFRVSFPVYRGFDIHFYSLLGNVSANEYSLNRNLNFQSSIFTGGLGIAYNFDHLLPANRRISPYISVGFESIEFNSKTDLFDEFGNTYYYWTDGSIRNLPESLENEPISTRLSRDYVYETDIRSLDADGFGNYSQQTFSVPVGVGAELYITDKLSLRIGSALHITFTDLLDGITPQSVGTRAGNAQNDMFLYSSFSLAYNLSNKPDSYLGLSRRDLKALDLGDEDDDGVIDFKDNCPGTPYGAEVDNEGCPLDSDGDGVPDYKDLEENTPDSAVVDSLGQTMTEEEAQEVAKFYNDSTGEDGAFADTSFALELTDKTKRPGKGKTRPTEGGTLVQPSESTTTPNETSTPPTNTAIAIAGLGIPTPECYEGVVYRVQIMATKVKPKTNPFPSINDLTGTDFGDGYYRFFTGEFNTKQQADKRKAELKAQGFSDPFVRVFQDCELLPINAKPTGQPANLSKPVPSVGGTGSAIDGLNVKSPACSDTKTYLVQIEAQRKKPNANPFPNVDDLLGQQFSDGYYRFFAGQFNSKTAAQQRLAQAKANGFTDAFIKAMVNCQSVPINGGESTPSPTNTPVEDNSTGASTPAETPAEQANVTENNFQLPPDMDPDKFKFRVLLASYNGEANAADKSKFENFGPVDEIKRNGKTYLYMGQFPRLQMAKNFKKELESEGLNGLSLSGEYNGKVLSDQEFNALFK